VQSLAAVYPFLAIDMKWVTKYWLARIRLLGRLKQKAWDGIFRTQYVYHIKLLEAAITDLRMQLLPFHDINVLSE
jgi:hypothetical protein